MQNVIFRTYMMHKQFSLHTFFEPIIFCINHVVNPSFSLISSSLRFTLCGIGGVLLLSGLVLLTWIDQDDARHNFGHSGGMLS